MRFPRYNHSETVKVRLTLAKCKSALILCERATHKATVNAATAGSEELHKEFSAFVVDEGSKDR
ncbi:hypothetical protein [Bradyrhizobium sp.]|uniref:hypothetical protein n=1 Tax=Bradyrhizobium sp. TaxID=376 RepID=UPI003C739C7E